MYFKTLPKTKYPALKIVTSYLIIATTVAGSLSAQAQALRNRVALPDVNKWDPLSAKTYQEGSADPTAKVFSHNGTTKLYVYTSTDSLNLCNQNNPPRAKNKTYDGFSGFCMQQYRVFSTTDKQLKAWTWKTHNPVLWQEQVPWAKKAANGFGGTASMWAPDVIKHNNKYVMFFPTIKKSNGHQTIGVARSNSPTGPFIADNNPLGGVVHVFDPSVIKVGNQWYMFYAKNGFGGRKAIWVANIDAGFTTTWNHRDLKLKPGKYLEGPHAYFVGNNLWLQYANGSAPGGGYQIEQAVAWNNNNPHAMFDTRPGLLMPNVGTNGTNHGSLVYWDNKFWAFYHEHRQPNGSPWNKRKAMYSLVQINWGARGKVIPFRPGNFRNIPTLGN